MITVKMKTNSGSWQEYDLSVTEEELKKWRKKFKAEQKAWMAKSELPLIAYPWNGVAIDTFRDDRPDIQGLDKMFLCFAVRFTKNPIKKRR